MAQPAPAPRRALQEQLPSQSHAPELHGTPKTDGAVASPCTHPGHTGKRCSPAASQAPHEPTGVGSRHPLAPPATPSLCACKGNRCAQPQLQLVLDGPRGAIAFPAACRFLRASAPGQRTSALPFPSRLYSGAPAPPAQCCSEQSSSLVPPGSGGCSSKIAGPLLSTVSDAVWRMPDAGSRLWSVLLSHITTLLSAEPALGSRGRQALANKLLSCLSTHSVQKHPKEHLVIRTSNLGGEVQATSLKGEKKKKKEKLERVGV